MFKLYFWGDDVNPWTFGVSGAVVGYGRGFFLDLGPMTFGIWISKEILDWN